MPVSFFTVPSEPNNAVLFERFGRAAGVPDYVVAKLREVKVEIKNQALSSEKCLALLRLNRILKNSDPPGYAFPRNGEMAKLQARTAVVERIRNARAFSNTPIAVEPESLARLATLRTEILTWLEENRFPVHGTIDDLNLPPLEAPTGPKESNDVPDWEGLVLVLAQALHSLANEFTKKIEKIESARDWWKKKADEFQCIAQRHPENLREIEAARDWWKKKADEFQGIAQRHPENLREITAYLEKVEAARDWWHEKSNEFEAQCRNTSETLREI